MSPLYFDNNATTPLDPRVLEAMLPYFTEHFGNAESSQHAYGWKAKLAIDEARNQVARLLNALPGEILFTSGATESMNLAIFGALGMMPPGRHLISTNAEHKATLEICARARQAGHDVTLLPVNEFGQVTAADILAALRPNTALVTLLHANNEIGSLNDVAAIGAALEGKGIFFHVDAAQTAGKEPIDVKTMKIDLLSISAHKFYGPKGVGALYLRRPDVTLSPVLVGGGQERGLRSGTHNVPGIVGLGSACAVVMTEMPGERTRLRGLRDRLIAAVKGPDVKLNGHPTERVCNNVHLSLQGVSGDQLLTGLGDIAFSTASACAGGSESHVLKAIGRASQDPLISSARFGIGRFTTTLEVEHLIARLQDVIRKSRAVSKSYDTSATAVPKN